MWAKGAAVVVMPHPKKAFVDTLLHSSRSFGAAQGLKSKTFGAPRHHFLKGVHRQLKKRKKDNGSSPIPERLLVWIRSQLLPVPVQINPITGSIEEATQLPLR